MKPPEIIISPESAVAIGTGIAAMFGAFAAWVVSEFKVRKARNDRNTEHLRTIDARQAEQIALLTRRITALEAKVGIETKAT